MRIDAVAHRAVERVVQRELDGIALADADHRARHGSVIGPIMVADPLGEQPADRPGFQLDMNRRRLLAIDRRSNRGRGQPLEVRGQLGNQSLVRHGSRRRGDRGGCASCAGAQVTDQGVQKAAGSVTNRANGPNRSRRLFPEFLCGMLGLPLKGATGFATRAFFDFSGQILAGGCRPEPEGRLTVDDD